MKPSQVYFINELNKAGPTRILDFGSSKGGLWSHLPSNVDVWGCDVQLHPDMENVLKGREDHFRLSEDPRKIPYEDSLFDIVFSNSVFEHVEFLEDIIPECARVLKPGGRLIAIFPTSSTVLEPHVYVPFAHRMPTGAIRRAWCAAFYALKKNNWVQRHGSEAAARADSYIENHTSYRPHNYCMDLLDQYFDCRSIASELAELKKGRRYPDWAVSRFYSIAVDAVRRA